MKRKLIAGALLFGILSLTACSNTEDESKQDEVVNEKEVVEEVKEPIEVEKVDLEDGRLSLLQDYLTILYYRNDGYQDYVSLHANPDKAVSEEVFDSFRQGSSLVDSFGTEDIETIMKTMKVEETSETEAIVYWVEQEEQTLEDAKQSWKVVKVEDEWKLAD
ncbi:hypothetical protein [Savagea faecisuis]|uniref:Lipoprotein n=1 Tax=Savagea faecisuis TaxID=1274803 RepID=A0ABW3GWT6_9BACL